MDWRNASLLIWLLPALGGWVGFSVYSFYRNRAARERFMAATMSEKLMPSHSLARQIGKVVLQTTGIAALVVALAGPQFGEQIETIVPKGSDLYILLDVSRSMLADDVFPNRLDRAKADISTLVSDLTGERVGLIAFAGQAVVKVPLTVDYESFRRALADVDTTSAPRGGTAIGDAIRKALEVFKPNSQRDQAILLITDGDDQKSAPLEAAEVAAERGVTIFAVGLGDTIQGARIPVKDRNGQFVEYEGEQVWSKLDSSLLEQIALKTSGVFIPAGTKSYDLREIYKNYLSDRGGDTSETQTRIRRGEQFQWFLGFGLMLLVIDLFVKPYKALPSVGVESSHFSRRTSSLNRTAAAVLGFTLSSLGAFSCSFANDATASMKQGLRQYEQSDFEKASELFAKAGDSLREAKSDAQHMAYFDQACAEQRLGNKNKAMDLYLQAAMARDRVLAAKAKFNLARLHVDAAQELWGDGTTVVEKKEDREKIVDEARQAIAAYRSSMDLDPDATAARRNIEIVRQWLKVVTDQWSEYDRNKRRNEADLLQFLDYMQGVQRELQTASAALKDLFQLDRHAELKLLQDSLLDEFPFLNEKIQEALTPNEEDPKVSASEDEKRELKKVVDLMLGWSDTARDHMKVSSKSLGKFKASESLESQQKSLDELDKIWNAVAPIDATLQRALAEQRKVESALKRFEKETEQESISQKTIREQERVLARAVTLKPKAEGMLAELETMASEMESSESEEEMGAANEQQEQLREFLNKAIELAPSAVEEIQAAIEQMNKNDGAEAFAHASEARRILEEISKSQPKSQDQQQDQQQNQDSESQQQDQQQNESGEGNSSEDQKQDQDESQQADQNNQEGDQDKKENQEDSGEKDDDKDKDGESQDEQQKDTNKQKEDEKSPAESDLKKDDKTPSQDRIAEALRKVREREAEKRERDRQRRLRAYGQLSVEKDW